MWLENFWEGWKDTSDQLIAGGVSTFLRIIFRLCAHSPFWRRPSVLVLAECNVCDWGWSLELGFLKADGVDAVTESARRVVQVMSRGRSRFGPTMCQVPVPERPEGTGTPRPAERQAIFILLVHCFVSSPYITLARF